MLPVSALIKVRPTASRLPGGAIPTPHSGCNATDPVKGDCRFGDNSCPIGRHSRKVAKQASLSAGI